jgi:hypothetical protein
MNDNLLKAYGIVFYLDLAVALGYIVKYVIDNQVNDYLIALDVLIIAGLLLIIKKLYSEAGR